MCVLFLSGLLPSCIAMALISLMACRPLEMVTFRNSLRGMAMLLCDLENAENEYVSNALKMLSHDLVISIFLFFKSIFFSFFCKVCCSQFVITLALEVLQQITDEKLWGSHFSTF